MACIDVTAVANTAPYICHTVTLNHPCACHMCCLHMLTFGAAMVYQRGSEWRPLMVDGKIQCVTSPNIITLLANSNGNVQEFAAAVMARGLRALPRRTIGVSPIHVDNAPPKKPRKRKSETTTTTPTKKPATTTTAKAMMPTTTRRKTICLLDDDEMDPLTETAAASSSTGGGGAATHDHDDDDDDDDSTQHNSDDDQDDDER